MDTKEVTEMNANDIHRFVMFGFNYPPNFIEEAWGDEPMMKDHLQKKFVDYYNIYGSSAVMNQFWVNLDGKNREILINYINLNYK